MNITSLGKIAVTTAGTPVTLPNVTCNQFMVSPVASNAGNIYIGVPGMVKATGVGVIRIIPKPPTSGDCDNYNPVSATGGNPFTLNEFAIDADNSGEGVYLSYFTE